MVTCVKILVYDIPAVHGGALTVLKECYDFACTCKDIEWVFVVSVPDIVAHDHIAVYCVPEKTRKRANRILFEHTQLQRIIRRERCDCFLSLVNVVIPGNKKKQVVYMHNAIPFSDISFSFKKDRALWMYKHIIGAIVRRSMKQCGAIIVQTKWIRDAIVERCGVPLNKFILCPPSLQGKIFPQYRDTAESRHRFIYPAGLSIYKNHKVILQATRLLQAQGRRDFSVFFTANLTTNTLNGHSLEALPVEGIGLLSYTERLDLYAGSVLLFPSQLETFGLPLLEARRVGAMILACDKPFSRDVLEGYENAYFFHEDDAECLADLMAQIMDGTLPYCPNQHVQQTVSGWESVISCLTQKMKN